MDSGDGYYEGAAGRLHYRWWSAPDPAWVVLFAHGFGDHSGRWQRYGETLAAAGGAVYAPDHRGHGLSDGDRAAVEDFDVAASEYLAARGVEGFPSELPLILAGHSMGGLIVSRAALSDTVAPAGLAMSGARLGRWATADSLLESIERGDADPTPGRGHPLLDPKSDIPPDALSRDTSIVQMFLDDDLAYKGPWPLPTLRATVRAEEAGEGALTVPVLYMHGGGDYITQFRGSVERLAILVADDLEVRIFPGARHSIFNEINRDEIFAVLLAFIARVT